MTVSINGSGGITYPDGSVNTTRSVSTAGDTMSGPLNVPANASGNQTPRVSEVVKKAGDTVTGSITSNKAGFRTATSSRFALTTADVGNIHINTTDQGVGVTGSKQHGITFAPLTNGTQGGIVFAENGSDGVGVGIYTSAVYNGGPILNFAVSPQGYISKPNNPAFSCSADLYYPQVTFNNTVLTLSSSNFPSNGFSVQCSSPHFSSSTGLFTAPVAGTYFFTAYFSRRGGNGTIDIYKNGGATVNNGAIRGLSYGTDWQTVTVSVVVTLAANDNIKAMIGATNATSVSGYSAGFCGHMIG